MMITIQLICAPEEKWPARLYAWVLSGVLTVAVNLIAALGSKP